MSVLGIAGVIVGIIGVIIIAIPFIRGATGSFVAVTGNSSTPSNYEFFWHSIIGGAISFIGFTVATLDKK